VNNDFKKKFLFQTLLFVVDTMKEEIFQHWFVVDRGQRILRHLYLANIE
jgi:hypothetical protein